MPTLSVITAAHSSGGGFLPWAVDSVAEQELPAGWRIEWIVQEDGEDPELQKMFERTQVEVHYEANHSQLGIAATRNLALTRAAGDLVHVLDCDDVLLPGALRTTIPLFADTTIHWAAGQADDLMPDGTRRGWASAMPYGRIEAGSVNAWVEGHGANWPIHCAGLTLRSVALRAVGGWVGLPGDEDTAMFAALSEIADGFNVGRVTWLYRQHDRQITRAGTARHLTNHTRRFAVQRARAVRAAQLSFGPDAEFEPGIDLHSVDVDPRGKMRPAIQ